MTIAELEQRIGGQLGRLPDYVLYFGRGTVGFERHFRDFTAWPERLAPRCLEIMHSAPASEWPADNILAMLMREGVRLPSKCNAWHVVALLVSSSR